MTFGGLFTYVLGSPSTSTRSRGRTAHRNGSRLRAEPAADSQRGDYAQLRHAQETVRDQEDDLDKENLEFERKKRVQDHKCRMIESQSNALSSDLARERAERKEETERHNDTVRLSHNRTQVLEVQWRKLSQKYNKLLAEHKSLLMRFINDRADRIEERQVDKQFRDNLTKTPTLKEDALVAREKQYEATEKYCQKLEQEKHSLTATVRDLQASALRSLESTRWAPISYSEVEHRIKTFLTDVRRWSADHVTMSCQDSLGAANFAMFATTLLLHGCVASPEQLHHALSSSIPLQRGNKAATHLLAAAASSTIFQRFFSNPFHAFVAPSDEDNVLHQLDGQAIDRVYRILRRSDESGAEAWRCQLLRLLGTTTIATTSCEAAGVRLVNDFLAEFNLQDLPDPEPMQTSLLHIVNEVEELSRDLWTRKARIAVMDFPTLADHSGQGPRLFFKSDSDYLDPHSFHNAVLDGDPGALDGREVIMVCSPAIVAFGNAKGEDYDRFHVIKKAVVWMG